MSSVSSSVSASPQLLTEFLGPADDRSDFGTSTAPPTPMQTDTTRIEHELSCTDSDGELDESVEHGASTLLESSAVDGVSSLEIRLERAESGAAEAPPADGTVPAEEDSLPPPSTNHEHTTTTTTTLPKVPSPLSVPSPTSSMSTLPSTTSSSPTESASGARPTNGCASGVHKPQDDDTTDSRHRRYEELRRASDSHHASDSSSTPASPASSSSGAPSVHSSTPHRTPVPAPSTLSLLHSLQRSHLLCSHLHQSLSHYAQSQTRSLLDLEESLQHSRYFEWMLRLVTDSINGGGGASAPTATFPLFTAFTSAPTTSLLGQYSVNCYGDLFDKRRLVLNKPFGYAQEVEYKRLVHLIRMRPSLIAFALASFQWNMTAAAAAANAAAVPPMDSATLTTYKRSIDSVAKCCVWDLFGTEGAHSERQVAYVTRKTLQIMWERETEKARERSASHAYAALAATSPLPTPLPLHLFDHHSFLPKLFHEFNLLVGGDFLDRCLKDVLHLVLLYDDMDFSSDLMAMMPDATRPDEPPQPEVAQARMEMTNGDATHATDFFDFPPSPHPPPGSASAAARTPPLMHGRPTNNLYDLCTTLLEKLAQNIELLPRGMRRIGREIARLVYLSQHGLDPATASPVPTSDLLPADPHFDHVSTRLLSDYFFLNWLVNAVMFPESYTRGTSSLTENYPISSLAKRNLQAIGTVLIKLTSGSRFSSFSSSPDAESPSRSKRAPISRLDRFLELHQSSIIDWLRRVIDVDVDGEEDRSESAMMEHSDLESRVTIPASWKCESGSWSTHAAAQPESDLNPITMLPNDIFAIHGLMKGCWSAAVTVRIATMPNKKKNAPNGVTPPMPVPIAKLPMPTFPACLQPSPSSDGMLAPCPYSLDVLTVLLSSLSSLGDVPHFVPPNDNIHVLLDSGFTPLKLPAEVARLRGEWPFDDKTMRHAADILLRTLATMPLLPDDPAQACTQSVEDIFHDIATRHQLSLNPAVASQVHATHAILSRHLSSAWRQDSFRPFLLAVQHALLREQDLLLQSSSVSSRMLLNYGLVQKATERATRRDAEIAAQFKLLQLKRLLDLTRPKVRRLKKFLAVKTDPRPQMHAHLASPPTNTTGSAYDMPPTCVGSCPDNASQDRFLCSYCSRLLDRRRGLLKSFMNKYVVGEGVVVAHGSPATATAGATGAAIHAGMPDSAHPNASSLYVSVGIGPPLDIKDAAISSDISDYILSSAYPELFVRCEQADDSFYTRTARLARFFQYDFTQFYVYMSCMDLVPNPNQAIDTWKKWRETYVPEDTNSSAPQPHSLTGRAPVVLHLPSAKKPKTLRIPYLGVHSMSQGYRLLRSIDSEVKPKKKLDACVAVRTLLHTTLGSMSFTDLSAEPVARAHPDPATDAADVAQVQHRIATLNPFASLHTPSSLHSHSLHSLHPSSDSFDEVSAGSVEDYMAALCFLVVLANPPFLISNIQFLKSLYASASHCKAFIDLMVAMKYIDGAWSTLRHEIFALEAETAADRQRAQNKREQNVRQEKEMAQEAVDPSKQLQSLHPPSDATPRTDSASPTLLHANGIRSPQPASPHPHHESLHARLTAMGFASSDIFASLRALADQDPTSEEAALGAVVDHLLKANDKK